MPKTTLPAPAHSMSGGKPVPQTTILIVEDEAILALDLQRKITLMGYTVAGPLASGEEAIAFLSKNSVDLVLMDIELAGAITGITAAETIIQTMDVPIVFLTGFSHDLLLEQSKLAAPYGYLIKPVPEQEVAATLKMALNRHMLDRQLKESNIALERSEAKYRHLFENSPLGIFRTTMDGKALEVNAEMANILGCDTSEEAIRDFTDLGKQFYVDPDRRQEFIAQLQENGTVHHFEYEGRKKIGGKAWVSMNAKLTPTDELNGHGSEQVIDGFAMDITERKLARTYRETGMEVLQILNEPSELRESIQRVITVLKSRTGFYAVGIRLQNGEDYPYFAQEGFSEDFILTENSLVEHAADNSVCRDKDGNVKLECTCGLVISGETNTSHPLFTPGGSFWTNNSYPLLEISSSEDPRHNPRNQCIHKNYASVALIPIRKKEKIVGLIQLNDRRKNCFTLSTIELLETIASQIGDALLRKQTEETVRDSEEQHRVLVRNLPDIVMRFDRAGRHLFVSENVSEVFVLPPEQFLGRNHHELGYPENLCRFWSDSIQKVFEIGLPFESEFVFESKQGAVIHNCRFVPELDFQGQVKTVLSLSRDITAHRLAEQNYKTLFHEMLDGFALHEIICDEAGSPIDYRFLSVNPAFERMTGMKTADIVDRTVLEVLPNTEQHWIEAYGRVALTGEPIFFEDYSNELKKYFRVTAFQSAPNQFACIFADITERKRAEEKINHLAYFDQLTELPNRTLLLDRLRQAMVASTRNSRYGAVLLIDLDNFKALNDTLGHDMGDVLLRQVAQRLTECVRAEDTVARLGGDEFVVMLPSLSESQSEAATRIELVCGKIHASLNQKYELKNVAYHSTSSIGVSLFSGQKTEIDTLLKQADLAMYKAKDSGRNTLRFYDPDMEIVMMKRTALESELRQAVQNAQFVLHYQAQLADGEVTGAEALVRWQHPQRGLVSPLEFIPLAEGTGLILPLGHWVLETACRQLAGWATRPERAHLTIAVNVSAHQLHQADFVDQVLAVLKATGANPERLKLELTESLLVSDVEAVIKKMAALKGQGVGFALDDFGTGYSSLSYLKRLPLDQLKIDKSFVRDVLSDPNDASIAKTIIALAESLGLSVIAEGVETAMQRDFLANSGCHAYQGYFFSRPMPVDDFEQFLNLSLLETNVG